MYSYICIFLGLVLAEVLRRCCRAVLIAFTGPLSKVPGPLLMKFTEWPSIIVSLKGEQLNVNPRLFAQYGDIVRISPREVMIRGRDAIHKVLVEENFPKSPLYEMTREDRNITTLFSERDNVAYKEKRRLLSVGFSIAYLNGLEPIMHECIQSFEKVLRQKPADADGFANIDIYSIVGNLSTDVMSATSFGGSFQLTETGDMKMKSLIQDRLIKSTLRSEAPFLKLLPFACFQQSPELDRLTDEIVAKRRADLEKSDRKDLLQIFLDTHDRYPEDFTQKHIYDEMRVFTIAGSDTTSTTATFTVVSLLQNPEKLTILLEELDAAFATGNEEITFANTQNLSYLNACISESMRYRPIVLGGLPRIAEKATILEGYHIPEKTIVHCYTNMTMRDPRLWPDSDKFIPERWLGDYKGSKVDRRAYLPFSGGMRSCIGQQFSLKELRLILVTLLRRFELGYVEGQNYEMRVHTVAYFTQGKYMIRVRPRV